jgi:MoaA/NifB/PqqE/SkfB family radical SAM enzyme
MIRLPELDPRKTIASLFLLPDCDMACRFCASERGFSTMGPDTAEKLLDTLRAHGFESVVFGGGEPSLWPHDLGRLTRKARELGFVVQVCTNGVGLPERFPDDADVDRYILPLESMEPEVHDRLRIHERGHHALMLRRIEQLAGSGRALTVSTVITRANLHHLEEIADYLRGMEAHGVTVHAWHLYRFIPVGRGGRPNAEKLAVSRDEFLDACRRAKRSGLGFPVYRRDNMLRSSTVEFFWTEGTELHTGSDLET